VTPRLDAALEQTFHRAHTLLWRIADRPGRSGAHGRPSHGAGPGRDESGHGGLLQPERASARSGPTRPGRGRRTTAQRVFVLMWLAVVRRSSRLAGRRRPGSQANCLNVTQVAVAVSLTQTGGSLFLSYLRVTLLTGKIRVVADTSPTIADAANLSARLQIRKRRSEFLAGVNRLLGFFRDWTSFLSNISSETVVEQHLVYASMARHLCRFLLLYRFLCLQFFPTSLCSHWSRYN